MTMRVAIAGASGYVGGELLRLLQAHPDVQIGALTAATSAGTRLGEHHPQLPALAHRELLPTEAATLAGHDVVFLALPHGQSASVAAGLAPDMLVVDCAADHRLDDAGDWQRWYGGSHPGAWPYGLPELADCRQRLRTSTRIAVPGCYPTAISLALQPAVAAGVIQDPLSVVAITGTSGAGRSPKPHLLGSEVMGSVTAYGVAGAHRHNPEIRRNLGLLTGSAPMVSFTPVLAPMPRGILAVCSGSLDAGALNDAGAAAEQRVRRHYETCYADEPFVWLLPEGQEPTTAATLGSNSVQLQISVDPDAKRLVVTAAVDNLTKGTAGAAVQSMNLAMGFDETTGLTTAGVAP